MVQIAKLTADLFANTAQFESGIKRAQASFKKFGNALKVGAQAGAVAIAAIGGALAAMGISQAKVIDETAKLSAALGVNIREFQALALAGSEAGISQEQIGTIITKSQRSILEAARGLQTYQRSFKTLNLDAKELIGLAPEEQFKVIANALNNVDNATVRTSTALEIFGRSGRQVINMLGGFKDNLDAAREFNDKFGISLNKIDAAKVEEANDTFARVKLAVSALGNVIAIEFAPLITAVSNAFLDSGFSAKEFGKSVKSAIEIASIVIDNFRISILGLKAIFAELRLALDLFVLDASKGLFDLTKSMEKLTGVTAATTKAQQFFLNVNRNALQNAKKNDQAIKDLSASAGKFTKISDRLAKAQKDANDRARERFSMDIPKGEESINRALEKQEKQTKKLSEEEKERLKNAKELGSTFASAFEKAIQGGEKFSDVLQGLLTDIQNILIRRTITEPIGDAITGVVNNSSGGGGGFFSDIFGSIFGSLPSFDVGTNNVPRDMIAQIHKGEMIVPAYDANKMRNGGMGGGGLSITINNNAGAEVSAQERQTGNGRELNIMIEKVVADGINRKGSAINTSLQAQQSQAIKRR